jgi:voltage-gated potassium channel Kch
MFLATDRLVFYFSPLSVLDFATIVPGLLSVIIAESAFSPEAFIVSQTLRVFRIFRAIRLLRIIVLSTSSSLTRQGMVLAVTVLAMVFAAAAIFQIIDSTPDDFVPFHKAVLYMTITIIGRPPIPTHTDAARIFETITIFIGSFLIPAFIAEMARLYFEEQGREFYTPDPRNPHVVICGDVNTSRLRAFLVQFFHKSRDPELLCPVVVLSDQKYEGALRLMIEQSRYAGNIRYIRGSARKPADLKRAAASLASTVIVLCHRTNDVDAAKADADVVSTCLALKNVNRRVRVLAQIRRPRSREHLLCLPGWRDSDRAVAVASLSMTLVGVGSLVPGLPTLLTNLIHQGNKGFARSSNPRRRKVVAKHGARLGGLQTQAAGMIVATTGPWWAAPLTSLLEALEDAGKALAGRREDPDEIEQEEADAVLEQLLRPMTTVEEYTSGFAQEMFAFAVTPGLAGKTFSAAARIAYLRFGILFIGARVPVGRPATTAAKNAAAAAAAAASTTPTPTPGGGGGGGLASPGAATPAAGGGGGAAASAAADPDAAYHVLLFPADVILRRDMFIHAIAFDTLDMAALLHSTGGGSAEHARAIAAAAAGNAPSGGMRRIDSSSSFGGSSLDLAALGAAAADGRAGAAAASAAAAVGANGFHNHSASLDITVPWCFTEHEEDRAETIMHVLRARGTAMAAAGSHAEGGGGADGGGEGHTSHAAHRLPNGVVVHACTCEQHETWSSRLRIAAAAATVAASASATASTGAGAGTGSGAGAGAATPSSSIVVGGFTGATVPSSASRPVRRARGYSEVDGDDGLGPALMGAGGAGGGDGGSAGRQLSRSDTLALLEDDDLPGGGGNGSEGGPDDGDLALLEEGDDDEEEEEDEEDDDDEEEEEVDADEDGFSIDPDARTRGSALGGAGARKARNRGSLPGAAASNSSARPPLVPPSRLGGGTRGSITGSAAGGGAGTASVDGDSVHTGGDDGLGHDDDALAAVVRSDSGVLRGGGGGRPKRAGSRGVITRGLSWRKSAAGGGKGASSAYGLSRSAQRISEAHARLLSTIRASMPHAGPAASLGIARLPRGAGYGGGAAAGGGGGGGVSSSLTQYRDHILICGMSDAVGLLLRALQTPPPAPPRPVIPGLPQLLASALAASAVPPSGHGSAAATAAAAAALALSQRPVQIVALCAVSDRPSDNLVNGMHAGSSRWLSRVTWVNGSPSDLGDLLRAGVETARAAIVLSSQKLQANPDGTDNLADDSEAIVIASAIYKLNPALHVLSEVVHGPHASYLRPCGTSLTDAEDSATAFLSSARSAAALRVKLEARQKRMDEEKARKAATMAAGGVPIVTAPTGTAGGARPRSTAQSPTRGQRKQGGAGVGVGAGAAGGGPAATAAAPPATPASAPVPPGGPTPHASTPLPASPADARSVSGSDMMSPVSASGLAFSPPSASGGGGGGAGAIAPPPPLSLRPSSPQHHAAAVDGQQTGTSSVDTIASPTPPVDGEGLAAAAAAMAAATGLVDEDGASGANAGAAAEGAADGGAGGGARRRVGPDGTPLGDDDDDHMLVGASQASMTSAIADKLARERIRKALGSGDSIGRTLISKPVSRPALAGVFAGVKSGRNSAAVSAAASPALAAAAGPVGGEGGDADAFALSEPAVGGAESAAHSGSVLPTGVAAQDEWAVRIDDAAFAAAAAAAVARPSSAHHPEAAAELDPWAPVGVTAPTMRMARQVSGSTISSPGAAASFPAHGGVAGSDLDADAASAAAAAAGSSAAAASAALPAPAALAAPAPSSSSGGQSSGQKIGAPNDIFGAPAFAAGRAFSSATLDALLCEAHFAPHVIFVIKQLVRASRKQRLQLLPITDAVALAMLVSPAAVPVPPAADDGGAGLGMSASFVVRALSPGGPARAFGAGGGSSAWETHGAVHTAARDAIAIAASSAPLRPTLPATGVTAQVLLAAHAAAGTGIGPAAPAHAGAGAALATSQALALPSILTYGQLFEALLRGWGLLPLGLYRRLIPGTAPAPPQITDPIGHYIAAFSPMAVGGGGQGAGGAHTPFRESRVKGGGGFGVCAARPPPHPRLPPPHPSPAGNDKSLLSYVFTNPPPDTVLGAHDLVYVIRPGGPEGEDE